LFGKLYSDPLSGTLHTLSQSGLVTLPAGLPFSETELNILEFK